MKIKDGQVEGSPDEIKDFIKDNGLDATKFLRLPKEDIALSWVIGPAIVLALLVILTAVLARTGFGGTRLMLFTSLCVAVWLCGSVHLRWKNKFLTIFLGVALLIILLLATDLITPEQAIDVLKKPAKGE